MTGVDEMESEQHREAIAEKCAELEKEGFFVLKLGRAIPDAIAFKDGKWYAVEALGQRYIPGAGWKNRETLAQKCKRLQYARFEQIFFIKFHYAKKEHPTRENRAAPLFP